MRSFFKEDPSTRLYLFVIFPIWFLLIAIVSCSNPPEEAQAEAAGSFMDMQSTQVPQLLAPELLASSMNEYNGTFSPDGTEFFFTSDAPGHGIISHTTLQEDGRWTFPVVASFSGRYSEYDPIFSPDGNRLYFSSERPVAGEKREQPTHIWYVERTAGGWGPPQYVDLKVDGNYYNSITTGGRIYFNRWATGDLFRTVERGDTLAIETLPEPINLPHNAGDPFIAPGEDYLIYRGYQNSLGHGDLYISYKIGDRWMEPENLGAPINSPAHEMCPYVTTDGKFLIFASSRLNETYEVPGGTSLRTIRAKHQSADNGELNIYYISADFIEKGREKHLLETE